MQLEAERAHLVLSELARVRNALAVQATADPTPARDAERRRVVTALKELVAAFRDVGADAWFARDLSWVVEAFRATGWDATAPPAGKPAAGAAEPPSAPRVLQLADELSGWVSRVLTVITPPGSPHPSGGGAPAAPVASRASAPPPPRTGGGGGDLSATATEFVPSFGM